MTGDAANEVYGLKDLNLVDEGLKTRKLTTLIKLEGEPTRDVTNKKNLIDKRPITLQLSQFVTGVGSGVCE